MNRCPACEQSIAYTNSRCPYCGMRTPRGLLQRKTLSRLEESFPLLKISYVFFSSTMIILVFAAGCLPDGIYLMWVVWYLTAMVGVIAKRRCLRAGKVTGTVVWVEAALLTDLCLLLLISLGLIGIDLLGDSFEFIDQEFLDWAIFRLMPMLLLVGSLLGHFLILMFLLNLVRTLEAEQLAEELPRQVIFNGSMLAIITVGVICSTVSHSEMLNACLQYAFLPICLICVTLSYILALNNAEYVIPGSRSQMLPDVWDAAGE